MAQPGAVPLGRLQCSRCEPPPPDPGPPKEYAPYALRMTSWSNCSAAPLTWAGSVPARPIAAASGQTPGRSRASSHTWPVWGPTSPTYTRRASSLPPRGWPACRTACGWGPSSQGGGGGLVTLLHACLLNGSQVREHSQEHGLSVRNEPARGAVLAGVTLHLPPALPAAQRRAVVSDTSAFLHIIAYGRGQCQDRGRQPQQGPRPP